jgi:hypothetical protein
LGQIIFSIDSSIACRHAVMTFDPIQRIKDRRKAISSQMNPAQMFGFLESMV